MFCSTSEKLHLNYSGALFLKLSMFVLKCSWSIDINWFKRRLKLLKYRTVSGSSSTWVYKYKLKSNHVGHRLPGKILVHFWAGNVNLLWLERHVNDGDADSGSVLTRSISHTWRTSPYGHKIGMVLLVTFHSHPAWDWSSVGPGRPWTENQLSSFEALCGQSQVWILG